MNTKQHTHERTNDMMYLNLTVDKETVINQAVEYFEDEYSDWTLEDHIEEHEFTSPILFACGEYFVGEDPEECSYDAFDRWYTNGGFDDPEMVELINDYLTRVGLPTLKEIEEFYK